MSFHVALIEIFNFVCSGWSLKSTIKYGCSPKIKILPFLDLKNMNEHLYEFKRITEKQLGISDMSNVPVQASLDATGR